MTYVVNDNCVKCKLTDCVEVCPVDCFYEGENMLVINPDECIDCGVCEPECPINAIEPDTNKNTEKLVILNKEMSAKWPNINKKKIHCLMQINLKIYLTNLKSTLAINLAQAINNLVSLY